MSLYQFIVFRNEARPHSSSLHRTPQQALIDLAIGVHPRVSMYRTESMGYRKKFALAVGRSLVECEFARLIALKSRNQNICLRLGHP